MRSPNTTWTFKWTCEQNYQAKDSPSDMLKLPLIVAVFTMAAAVIRRVRLMTVTLRSLVPELSRLPIEQNLAEPTLGLAAP